MDVALNKLISSRNAYLNTVSTALNLYAKLQLYGINEENRIDLKLAFYFFKLASEYGNSEAQYYSGFLAFFRLDGAFSILQNLKNKNQSKNQKS